MSGTALYDSAMIVCYPVLYSFLPVLYFGILDQSVRTPTRPSPSPQPQLQPQPKTSPK